VSALSALEAAIVIHARKGPAGIRELDLLVHSAGATIVSFDADQVLLARSAYEKVRKRAPSRRPEPGRLLQLRNGSPERAGVS
jgi:uncharacterized protein with PIN domain